MNTVGAKLRIWIIISALVILACVLMWTIGHKWFDIQKERAKDIYITRLYESLDSFPQFDLMHTYGEFYLQDGDKEYLIVKKGDVILTAERDASETKYYESASNSQYSSSEENILGTIGKTISSRLKKDAVYACEKVKGPWKLRVMPESEWLVDCQRNGYSEKEYITYIKYEGAEQIGWVMYNKDDSVKMYVYLCSEFSVTENSAEHVFGWGAIERYQG